MRNIWRIFRADWQRISASVVAVVVIMGLCLIPCLYAWFNIFSNWDPYGPDATSNIRVAVTSEDEGYELLGLKLNIGSMGAGRPEKQQPDGLGLCRQPGRRPWRVSGPAGTTPP